MTVFNSQSKMLWEMKRHRLEFGDECTCLLLEVNKLTVGHVLPDELREFGPLHHEINHTCV